MFDDAVDTGPNLRIGLRARGHQDFRVFAPQKLDQNFRCEKIVEAAHDAGGLGAPEERRDGTMRLADDRYDVGLANTKGRKEVGSFCDLSQKRRMRQRDFNIAGICRAQHSDRWTRAAKLRRVHEELVNAFCGNEIVVRNIAPRPRRRRLTGYRLMRGAFLL